VQPLTSGILRAMDQLDRWFQVSQRGSTLGREVVGGATTFVSMAYILLVNPAILGAAGLPPQAVLASTALVAGLVTLLMGTFAGYPFALASGMGINAAVAFSLVGAQHLTPAEAMGVVLAEGLIVTLLAAVGFREAVLDAIPLDLKRAIAGGIGLFLAVIGLSGAGLVVGGPDGGPLSVRGELESARTIVFLVGLLVGAGLLARRVPGALLLGILSASVAGWMLGVTQTPTSLTSVPDLSLLGEVSFGFVVKLGVLGAVLAVFSLMLADFFDTIGTAVALGATGGFLVNGRLPNIRRVLLVDGLGAVAGGAASCSSATTYIESASGLAAGARTGLASVVTGVLFLMALVAGPLASVVPAEATAGALVLVGSLMLGVVREVAWDDPVHAIPVFLTLVFMPLASSITDGIGAGFLSYAALALSSGRGREVHPLMWGSCALFLVYFILG
jgi:AGZA family xanthine/uracil permease-like MFS transporter